MRRRCAARTWTRWSPRCGRRAPETRRAYSAALAQRNALLASIRAGRASRASLPAWDAELARHGVALMADRAATVERLRPRFAEHAAGLGLEGEVELRYRPRSKAADAADPGRRARRARRLGPRARLHRPRPAPRRPGVPPRGPRAARLRLARPAAPRSARAAARRARGAGLRARLRPAAAARRRHERARRHPPRAARGPAAPRRPGRGHDDRARPRAGGGGGRRGADRDRDGMAGRSSWSRATTRPGASRRWEASPGGLRLPPRAGTKRPRRETARVRGPPASRSTPWSTRSQPPTLLAAVQRSGRRSPGTFADGLGARRRARRGGHVACDSSVLSSELDLMSELVVGAPERGARPGGGPPPADPGHQSVICCVFAGISLRARVRIRNPRLLE